MTWNYRLMTNNGEIAVYEVYYRTDGSVEGWSATPVFPQANSLLEFTEDLKLYCDAINLPILEYTD